MGGSCLAERLARYVSLTAEEKHSLEALEEQTRTFRRGATIRRERDPARELFVVQTGWAQSCVLLGNGSRQILRFHFPGDIIGISSLAHGRSAETIVAVTEATLCPFEYDKIAVLFQRHPRLSALLFSVAVAERSAVADRLVSVGRTPARARVASLLCEILARLSHSEGRPVSEFHVPLTQEEIGDATGLTAVHVNRMLRALREDGAVISAQREVRIIDFTLLSDIANFDPSYLHAAA